MNIIPNKQNKIFRPTSVFTWRGEEANQIIAELMSVIIWADLVPSSDPNAPQIVEALTAMLMSKEDGEYLQAQINALKGVGGALTRHDFGTDTPTQEALTQYASEQIWGAGGTFTWNSGNPSASTYLVEGVTHPAASIFNATWVKNSFSADVWQLVNTQDTDPIVFVWENTGQNVVPEMVGATNTEAGASGLVPAPQAGDNNKYLCGDGIFKTLSNNEVDYGNLSGGSSNLINNISGHCIISGNHTLVLPNFVSGTENCLYLSIESTANASLTWTGGNFYNSSELLSTLISGNLYEVWLKGVVVNSAQYWVIDAINRG